MTQYHEQCVEILFRIYKDWDVSSLPQSVRVKLWEIFVNRVRTAAHQSTTLRQFIEKLSSMLEIHALSDPELLNLLHHDDECLVLFREEAKLLILMLRQKLYQAKERRKEHGKDDRSD